MSQPASLKSFVGCREFFLPLQKRWIWGGGGAFLSTISDPMVSSGLPDEVKFPYNLKGFQVEGKYWPYSQGHSFCADRNIRNSTLMVSQHIPVPIIVKVYT